MPSEKYDRYDVESIVEYATRLEGHTLRDMIPVDSIADPHRRRGSFGNAIEEYYFQIPINSNQAPDFEEAGLELKTSPVKKNAKGELIAKERLVITMIDYMSITDEEFEHSHLMDKTSDVLLITYLYEKDADPLDYEILAATRWSLPEEDLPQIKHDWDTVVEKIRSGHAEDISGSDTLYLEACTKAANSQVRRSQPFSDVPAKPRAWALKSSYMTAIQRQIIDNAQALKRTAAEKDLDLLTLVRTRFSPYFGKTEAELQALFGLSNSKNLCARITNKILGVGEDTEIAEFAKAGIKPKTMRLLKNGRPKEAVSFPAFDYFKLENQPFEESDFFEYLQQMYLFVIYREDDSGDFRLSDVCLWQMPDSDYDEARRCYEQMQQNVREGKADISVRSTANRCCHVRPHGRDSRDTRPQPHGEPVVKKCFWLNQNYLRDEIERSLE